MSSTTPPPAPPAYHDPSSPDSVQGPPVNIGSIVSFRQRGVQPPGALYITVLDSLQLTIISSLLAPTLSLVIKQLLTTGEIQTRVESVALPAGARTFATSQFGLAEGFLLSVDIIASAGVARGTCYVTGTLVRAASATTFNTVQPLFQGYVTSQNPIGWPLSAWENALSGYGFTSATTFGNPGAGQEIVITVPAGAIWQVHSLSYQLVTSATVSNRQSRIAIDGGAAASTFFINDSLGTQAASLTNNYTFAEGEQRQVLQLDTWQNALPLNCRLRQGSRIRTLTTNLQIGDSYQAITAFVEEWLSPS